MEVTVLAVLMLLTSEVHSTSELTTLKNLPVPSLKFVIQTMTTTQPTLYTHRQQSIYPVVRPLDIFLPDSSTVTCDEYVEKCRRTCMPLDMQIYAEQCAGGCVCDEACVRYSNCCPNFNTTCPKLYERELERLYSSMTNFSEVGNVGCIQNRMIGNTYHIVSQCPVGTPEHLQHQCAQAFDTVLHNIPVVDKKSRLHFRNQHCARCHGVSNFDFWSAEMHCEHMKPESPVNYPTVTEFVQLISTKSQYQLKAMYISCDIILTAVGKHSLNECPQLCPIHRPLPCIEPHRVSSKYPYSFGILMNFNNDGKIAVSAAGATQGTKSFQCSDKSLSSGRALFCAANACDEGYVLQNGKCLSPIVPALVIVSTMFQNDRSSPILPPVAADVTEVLGLMTWAAFHEAQSEAFFIKTEYMKFDTPRNLSSEEWDIRLEDFKRLARQSMQKIPGYLWLDAHAYRRLTGMLDEETATGTNISIGSNASTINSCSWLQYRQDEVFVIDRNNILLVKENRNISALRIVEQHDFIFVCTPKDVILHNAIDATKSAGYLSEVQGTVSFILVSLSVVCLLVRLLLQCRVTTFSSFPGRMQVCLCGTLLVAHTFFLVAPWLHTIPTACTTVAIILHWSFLSSVTWCSVISVDIAWTLRPSKMMKAGLQKTNTCKGILCGICAWLCPLIVVGCGVILEYAANVPSSWRPGYGQGMCWIQSPLVLLVLFVVPMSCLLVINVVTGVTVGAMLYHSSKASAAMKVGGGQGSGYPVSLYLRLMVLSGCSWLTGILAGAINSPALMYIFIVLNAGQGVYIFLAFVCRKRVLRELGVCKEVDETSSTKPTYLTHVRNNTTDNDSSQAGSV